jgi:hypothetical protein
VSDIESGQDRIEMAGCCTQQLRHTHSVERQLAPTHTHLAGDDGLHKEAKHAEHGQATVLDLLDLELSQGVLS